VADHLLHIEQEEEDSNEIPIDDAFPDEYLLSITANSPPWYVPFANFLVCGVFPPDLSFQVKKKFLVDVKYYQWDDLIITSTVRIKLCEGVCSERNGKHSAPLPCWRSGRSIWCNQDSSKGTTIRILLAYVV